MLKFAPGSIEAAVQIKWEIESSLASPGEDKQFTLLIGNLEYQIVEIIKKV